MSGFTHFIGWDVGAWHCDTNSKSRDAIVILDSELKIVGAPWRGNLRESINNAASTTDWIKALFKLCETAAPEAGKSCVMGIDTPLGFSDAFVQLLTQRTAVPVSKNFPENTYLFRQTERFLFGKGLRPLSAVQDMIGTQATKGMHVLAKFAPIIQSCGIWTDGQQLTAIEAYPAASKNSAIIKKLKENFQSLGHEDKDDAHTCALLAYLFAKERTQLVSPDDAISKQEGWIWVPRDGMRNE